MIPEKINDDGTSSVVFFVFSSLCFVRTGTERQHEILLCRENSSCSRRFVCDTSLFFKSFSLLSSVHFSAQFFFSFPFLSFLSFPFLSFLSFRFLSFPFHFFFSWRLSSLDLLTAIVRKTVTHHQR